MTNALYSDDIFISSAGTDQMDKTRIGYKIMIWSYCPLSIQMDKNF